MKLRNLSYMSFGWRCTWFQLLHRHSLWLPSSLLDVGWCSKGEIAYNYSCVVYFEFDVEYVGKQGFLVIANQIQKMSTEKYDVVVSVPGWARGLIEYRFDFGESIWESRKRRRFSGLDSSSRTDQCGWFLQWSAKRTIWISTGHAPCDRSWAGSGSDFISFFAFEGFFLTLSVRPSNFGFIIRRR